jgi:hypothetical protein
MNTRSLKRKQPAAQPADQPATRPTTRPAAQPAAYLEITCNTEYIEIVQPNEEGLQPMVLKRKFITIPVEGYNWITPSIAYYKSSALSNAATDSDFKRKLRAYMWFPTIGLMQENSLIDNVYKSIRNTKPQGFIIKNVPTDLSNAGWRVRQSPFDYFYSPAFTAYSRYIISPYLIWLGYSYDPKNPAITAITSKKIQDFQNFMDIMRQYCYNWKQIQDAVRLSLENTVDGIKLEVSEEYGDICKFILSHTLTSQKLDASTTLTECTLMPKMKVNIAQEMSISSEDVLLLNGHLLSVDALNENLLITPPNSTEDIKKQFDPYFMTMTLGVTFTKSSGGKTKKNKSNKKNKSRKYKLNKKNKSRKYKQTKRKHK